MYDCMIVLRCFAMVCTYMQSCDWPEVTLILSQSQMLSFVMSQSCTALQAASCQSHRTN